MSVCCCRSVYLKTFLFVDFLPVSLVVTNGWVFVHVCTCAYTCVVMCEMCLILIRICSLLCLSAELQKEKEEMCVGVRSCIPKKCPSPLQTCPAVLPCLTFFFLSIYPSLPLFPSSFYFCQPPSLSQLLLLSFLFYYSLILSVQTTAASSF